MLTLNMDVPEPWLVEPVRADYDLDNLRLEVPPDPLAPSSLYHFLYALSNQTSWG